MAIQAAQASTELETSLETAWKTLTNLKALGSAFFGSKVDTTWKVGDPIYFRGAWQGKPYEDKGNILVFSPSRQVRFTHWSNLSGVEDKPENYHVVTFDLFPGAKTVVRVTQENQDNKPMAEAAKQELAKNWSAILEGLKAAAEKADGSR